MQAAPYSLALVSCFLHAWWNFVLKRSKGEQLFIGLSKVGEAAVFLAPFLYAARSTHAPITAFWMLVAVGAGLTGLNYLCLGRAYSIGDLSVVYPVSRAGTLIFLPFLAFLFSGERVSALGGLCVLLIIGGTLMVQLQSFRRDDLWSAARGVHQPAATYALMAGFCAACYSLWDRHSVRYLAPFVYFYAYTALIAIGYVAWIVRHHRSAVVRELQKKWKQILTVGILNTITYLLVLFALREANATYVIAIRQLSIAIGAILGWLWLDEDLTMPKCLGTGALVMGCVIITFAH